MSDMANKKMSRGSFVFFGFIVGDGDSDGGCGCGSSGDTDFALLLVAAKLLLWVSTFLNDSLSAFGFTLVVIGVTGLFWSSFFVAVGNLPGFSAEEGFSSSLFFGCGFCDCCSNL